MPATGSVGEQTISKHRRVYLNALNNVEWACLLVKSMRLIDRAYIIN